MIKEITKIYPIVKDILEEFPDTRDNYNLLLLKVWAKQKPSLRDVNLPFVSGFALEFSRGQFASVLSVTRARRKVQSEHEHLRGLSYMNRKDKAKSVKFGINKF